MLATEQDPPRLWLKGEGFYGYGALRGSRYLSSSHRTHSKLLISKYSRSDMEHETVDPTSIPRATGSVINAKHGFRMFQLPLFLALMICAPRCLCSARSPIAQPANFGATCITKCRVCIRFLVWFISGPHGRYAPTGNPRAVSAEDG